MITKKATSTTLNPKSKAWNQQKEDRVQEQYLVFLVKREESRNFDVFFVFGREEKHVEDVQAESRTKGDLFFFFFLKGAWGLL